MNVFTKEEYLKISECILKTMDDMSRAKKDIIGQKAINAVNAEMEELRLLNDKVLLESEKAEVEKIVKSTCDGYITVKYVSGALTRTEGYDPCPEEIKALIKNGMAEEQDCFVNEVRL